MHWFCLSMSQLISFNLCMQQSSMYTCNEPLKANAQSLLMVLPPPMVLSHSITCQLQGAGYCCCCNCRTSISAKGLVVGCTCALVCCSQAPPDIAHGASSFHQSQHQSQHHSQHCTGQHTSPVQQSQSVVRLSADTQYARNTSTECIDVILINSVHRRDGTACCNLCNPWPRGGSSS